MTESLPSPDAVVIGAGSAGLTVAIGLAKFGKRVRLIERADVGGDCTNTGCIPSKALLHASVDPNGRTPREVLAFARERRDTLRDDETREMAEAERIDLQRGTARLGPAGVVDVVGPDGTRDRVEAKHIVIATGSRPRPLSIPGLGEQRVLTNENLFDLSDPPAHVAIVGAGPIGVEMATAFARLGSRVTLVEAAGEVLPTMLAEVGSMARQHLETLGVSVVTGCQAERFEEPVGSDAPAAGGTLVLRPTTGASPLSDLSVVEVDRVLVAVGRLANSNGLGLSEAGVEVDGADRVVVDGRGRTSVEGVWAAGDVTTTGATTHAASAWGRRIVKSIAFPFAPIGPEPLHPQVVFGPTEVATIGDLPERPESHVRRIVVDLARSDRAYTDEVGDGVIIVDVRAFSGRVLGAAIAAPRAGELISTISFAMKNNIPLQKWFGVVWPYPSHSDALSHVVDDYMIEHVHTMHRTLPRWAWARLRGRR